MGTGDGEPLTGSSANNTIYGFAGDDTLYGGDGNDVLRGGAGVDRLYGERGNDVLVYDGADAVIDGGLGFDTVRIENGTTTFSLENMANIEQIGITSTGTVTGTITAQEVLNATDYKNELIISGGENVQIGLDDATHHGQILIGDKAYEHYTMGYATVYVEDPIVVAVV